MINSKLLPNCEKYFDMHAAFIYFFIKSEKFFRWWHVCKELIINVCTRIVWFNRAGFNQVTNSSKANTMEWIFQTQLVLYTSDIKLRTVRVV